MTRKLLCTLVYTIVILAAGRFALAQTSPAALTSPLPGTQLPGSSVNFQWSAGVGVTYYQLQIGTTPGGANVFNAWLGTSLSTTVNTLPTDGSSLYLRLYSYIAGSWQYRDYTYFAVGPAATAAAIASPAPGTQLSGSSATFQWSAGVGVTYYQLSIGTSPGGANLYNKWLGNSLSTIVSTLPTDGSSLYVRLYSYIAGTWQYRDYAYLARGTSAPAAITSPVPGTQLSSSSVIFQWSAGVGVTYYQLSIGTAPGASNIYNQWLGTSLSTIVTGLPADGSSIYVRLHSYIAGSWQSLDYTYFGAGPTASPAAITSPSPGTQLSGSSATFQWSAGIGVTYYQLSIGTAPGSTNIYNKWLGNGLSTTVSTLPADGSSFYVRLYSYIAGSWQYRDYTYFSAAAADCTDGMNPGQTVAISGTVSNALPLMVLARNGMAIALWEQTDGTSGQSEVWSSLCMPGQGWAAPTRISDWTASATLPRVAIDGNGTAIAVWRQWDGTQYSIYASRYVPGSGWGSATLIESGAGQAGGFDQYSRELGGPQVAMDASGNAIAVWPQWDGAAWSIYVNRYQPGTGWGTEAVIETGSDEAMRPLVAMNDAGRAMVIWGYWHDPSSSYSGSVYSNNYEPGTGWATETRLDPGSGNAVSAQLALDSAGNAVAVWIQTNGNVTGSSVYVRRYEPGTGWGSGAHLVEVTGEFLLPPQMAISPTGMAVAVWTQGIQQLWTVISSGVRASVYVPGAGWAAPVLLTPGDWIVGAGNVAADGDGNAVAGWSYNNTLYLNRYTAATGWGTANAAMTASPPVTALEQDGDLLLLWSQPDVTGYYIAASRRSWP